MRGSNDIHVHDAGKWKGQVVGCLELQWWPVLALIGNNRTMLCFSSLVDEFQSVEPRTKRQQGWRAIMG